LGAILARNPQAVLPAVPGHAAGLKLLLSKLHPRRADNSFLEGQELGKFSILAFGHIETIRLFKIYQRNANRMV